MKLPQITIHGRFQPPLHINHKNYVLDAFDRAEKVTILITNPYLTESSVAEATHRNAKENNPFTYDERVHIFQKYFNQIGIPPERYEFKPFEITDEANWDKALDKSVPNLVNVYGEWSEAKYRKLSEKGYQVVRTNNPKEVPVSGTMIRSILRENCSDEEKEEQLIAAGYVPEAFNGLFEVLHKS